jgi:hypothetical protein
MSEQTDQNEATTHADLYHRHGTADPSQWDEAPTVTDRPNDTPLRGEDKPAVPNSTFGERAKATAKQVDSAVAEDKAVGSSETKSGRGRRAKK